MSLRVAYFVVFTLRVATTIRVANNFLGDFLCFKNLISKKGLDFCLGREYFSTNLTFIYSGWPKIKF